MYYISTHSYKQYLLIRPTIDQYISMGQEKTNCNLLTLKNLKRYFHEIYLVYLVVFYVISFRIFTNKKLVDNFCL